MELGDFPNTPQVGSGRAKLIVCFPYDPEPGETALKWAAERAAEENGLHKRQPEGRDAPTLPESDCMWVTDKLSLLCDFFYKIDFLLIKTLSRTTLSYFSFVTCLDPFSYVEITLWVDIS